MTMINDLREVVQACTDAKGHAPLSDTELTLRLFVKRHAAQIEQDARDGELWRRHKSSLGNGHTHICRKCGLGYSPIGSESEDCPSCGFNGIDAAMAEESEE